MGLQCQSSRCRLVLHLGFAIGNTDSRVPTKLLLFENSCQIIAAEAGYKRETPYPAILQKLPYEYFCFNVIPFVCLLLLALCVCVCLFVYLCFLLNDFKIFSLSSLFGSFLVVCLVCFSLYLFCLYFERLFEFVPQCLSVTLDSYWSLLCSVFFSSPLWNSSIHIKELFLSLFSILLFFKIQLEYFPICLSLILILPSAMLNHYNEFLISLYPLLHFSILEF